MNLTNHERPGVYSSYDASTVVDGSSGGKTVGLAALCRGGTPGQAELVTRYEEAVERFGEEGNLCSLVRLLLINGAAAVAAVPVRETENPAPDYQAAFAALEALEDAPIVVCDAADLETLRALRDSVKDASEARRERIGVACCAEGASVEAMARLAGELNSERMVLVAPGGKGGAPAAAAAGAIAGERDPAVPLGGAVLRGLEGLEARYGDGEIDLLVRGGVTPLESLAGAVSVVRGVTTRTKSGETGDTTWRELTTIRIVDDVIPAVRASLRAKFRRAKNTEQSRGAIRAQVILELENRLSREIITGYENVTVEAVEENPTVCLVSFSFTAAHGLNQIWLTAHITV